MNEIDENITELRKTYRDFFLKINENILDKISQLKPAFCNCGKCSEHHDLFDKFDDKCLYRQWQKDVLFYLENNLAKDIATKWKKILEFRKFYSCQGCATCCKLACSEFSYEELKQKALNDDTFAKQFLSVFVPYSNQNDAKKIYPEYIELLEQKLGDDEKVYFYYCPKLKDNRCTDYENRPQICRDFPNNPLSILPKSCGFWDWKKEVEEISLQLHATLEIIDFYKEKIKGNYND